MAEVYDFSHLGFVPESQPESQAFDPASLGFVEEAPLRPVEPPADLAQEPISKIEGIGRSFQRGVMRAQEMPDVLLAIGAAGMENPTMRQRRRAFVDAMSDPRYMDALTQAGSDPAKLMRAEARLGPPQRLEAAVGPAKTLQDELAADITESQRKIQEVPRTPARIRLGEAKTAGEKWSVWLRDPVELTAGIVAESLPPSIAGAILGTVTAGPGGGTALGAGAASGLMTLTSELLNNAHNLGYKLDDPKSFVEFLRNEKDFKKAFNPAMVKAGIVGQVDAATAGAAGRWIEPALKEGLKSVVKASAKEIALQAAGGGGGELVSRVATQQPVDWFDVAMEAIAEIGSAPAEVVSNVRQAQRGRSVRPLPRTPNGIDPIFNQLGFSEEPAGVAPVGQAVEAPSPRDSLPRPAGQPTQRPVVAPPVETPESAPVAPQATVIPERATLGGSQPGSGLNKFGDPEGTTYHATPADWEEWKKIISQPPMESWAAREAMRNRYGGMYPEAPSENAPNKDPGAAAGTPTQIGGTPAVVKPGVPPVNQFVEQATNEYLERLEAKAPGAGEAIRATFAKQASGGAGSLTADEQRLIDSFLKDVQTRAQQLATDAGVTPPKPSGRSLRPKKATPQVPTETTPEAVAGSTKSIESVSQIVRDRVIALPSVQNSLKNSPDNLLVQIEADTKKVLGEIGGEIATRAGNDWAGRPWAKAYDDVAKDSKALAKGIYDYLLRKNPPAPMSIIAKGDWIEYVDDYGKTHQGKVDEAWTTAAIVPTRAGVKTRVIRHEFSIVDAKGRPMVSPAPGTPLNKISPPATQPTVPETKEVKAGTIGELSETDLDAMLDEAQGSAPKPAPAAKPKYAPAIRRPTPTESPQVKAIRDELKKLRQGLPVAEDMAMNDRGAALDRLQAKIAEAQARLDAALLQSGGRSAVLPNQPAAKSAADILKDAAKEGIKGADEAMKGLHDLFGGGTHMGSSGPSFDEETYAKAKPHFEEAYNSFKKAGKSLSDFLKFIFQKFGERIRPYLKRFVQEMQAKEKIAGLDKPTQTKEVEVSDVNEPTKGGSGSGSVGGKQPAPAGVTGGTKGTPAAPAKEGEGVQSGVRPKDEGTGPPGRAGDSGKPDADADRVPGEQTATTPEPTGGGHVTAGSGSVRSDDAIAPAPEVGAPTPKNIRLAENPAPTGAVARVDANLAAIRLLKKLEAENRFPTDAERSTLAKWSGWGSFKELFNEGRAEKRDWDASWMKRYGKAYDVLKKLLTQEEFDAAAESSVNAHYTSKEAVTAMWSLVKRLGYAGGQALEPSTGSGVFVGYAPDDIAATTRWTGVEMEPMTGKIFAYLYPEADTRIQGFEKAKLPNGYYDLAITNVPFHEVGPGGEYPDLNLHNYFIARMLDKVKPGGLVLVITTHNTMDSRADQRRFLSEKGQLIGAIRLPSSAFKESAATEVVTDIIALRKPDGKPFDAGRWLNTNRIELPDGPADINEYFVNNPDMVLGKNALTGTMYRDKSYTVEPTAGDIGPKLARAIEKFPQNILQSAAPDEGKITQLEEGSLTVEGDQVLEARNFRSQPPTSWDPANETLVKRAKRYISLRDLLKEQYRLEDDPKATDQEVADNRKKLGAAYEALRKNVDGRLNASERKLGFLSTDPDYYTVMGLEITREVETPGDSSSTTTVIEPADVLSRRVKVPNVPPERADNATDALSISLSYRGGLDMDYIQQLTGLTHEQIESELVGAGLGFKNPESGMFEVAQDYLTGEVRDKLAKAIFAAKESPLFERNVEALRKIIPPNVPFDKIKLGVSSRWLTPNVLNAFAAEIMGLNGNEISFVPVIEEFAVKASGRLSNKATTEWSTPNMNALELLRYALNFKRARIMVEVEKGKYREDTTASAVNNQIIDRIKTDFDQWVRTSPTKLPYRFFDDQHGEHVTMDLSLWDVLEREFNRTKNSFVVPDIDGSPLKIPGMSQMVRRTPHLLNGVMRAITQGSAVFGHGVGSGKTFLAIVTMRELQRIGLMKKGAIVIKKPTVAQFRVSIERAFPGSRVLMPTKKDFEPANRRKLAARIASGRWDFIILTHEQFKAIRTSEESVKAFFNDQIEQLRLILRTVGGKSGDEDAKSTRGMDPAVRNIVKKIKSLKKRLDKHATAIAKNQDKGLMWENLGIDGVWVDESHNYKKLPIPTQMDNVKGIPSDFSQRAVDLLIKIRDVQRRTNGRNVFFASGTPVSNTLAELWVMFHATNPELLKQFGIETFDSFATSYADVTTNFELGWDNSHKDVTRMARFKNGASLTLLTRMGMDVRIGNKELGLDVPELDGGKPKVIVTKQTPAFARWAALLQQVADEWDGLDPKGRFEWSWIPITAMRAGSAAALDPRLVFPDAEDDPNSKVNTAVRMVLDEWKRGAEIRTTMMIFADLYRTLDTSKLMSFIGGQATPPAAVEVELPEGAEEKEVDEDIDSAASDEDAVVAHAVGTFNIYNDIRAKLIAAGVPESEIAVITEHDSDLKRETLFNKVRSGSVRILIGSTEKIGEGVDVPQRMSAQFHLDPPMQMTPAKMEQRFGRIIRQGNLHSPKNWNLPVRINLFAQERSMDAPIYQMLETKGVMVIQALKGMHLGDEFDDPASELTLAMAEMKAAATGDTRALDLAKLQKQVRELSLEEGVYFRRHSELKRNVEMSQYEAESQRKTATRYNELADAVEKDVADKESVTLTHKDKQYVGEKAIDALLEKLHPAFVALLDKEGASATVHMRIGDRTHVMVEGKTRKYSDGPLETNYAATYWLGGELTWLSPRWDSNVNSIESVMRVAKGIPSNARGRAESSKLTAAKADALGAGYAEQLAKLKFEKGELLQQKKAELNALESAMRKPAKVAPQAGGNAALGPTVTAPLTQPAVEAVVREFFGGEIPVNVRFVNDPNQPRGLVEMTPGQRGRITLNLAKLDSPELVRDTLREELVHTVWDSPAVADARRAIEALVSDVDRARQAEEGYNPEETQEEAANERARRIFEDAKKSNIFAKAWRAIVEAIKRLFRIKLNSDETARVAARTIMREAMKNEPTTRRGKVVVASNAVVDATSGLVSIGPRTRLAIAAHHGTPHKVDKFTTEKIGTGEGAQVYGWGLYFAENPAVAKQYRETIGRAIRVFKNGKWYVEQGGKEVAGPFARDDQAFNAAKDFPGREYTVSLNVEPDELLDWDKPLSEQSEQVKAVLKTAGVYSEYSKQEPSPGAIERQNSGANLYTSLSQRFAKRVQDTASWTQMTALVFRGDEMIGNERRASEYLASLGIKGIRYLDQGSRNAFEVRKGMGGSYPQDYWLVVDPRDLAAPAKTFFNRAEADAYAASKRTHNYVIFSENDIQITHENGQPVSIAQAADEQKVVRGAEPVESRDDISEEIERAIADAEGVPTKVFGRTDTVAGRGKLNREAGALFAKQVFQSANVNVVQQDNGLWELADPLTAQEEQGQALLAALRAELGTQQESDRPDTGALGNLLNSVVANMTQDDLAAFSPQLKRELYAVAQGERSHRGVMLAALAGFSKTVSYVARHVDVLLQRTYSDQFGGAEVSRVVTTALDDFKDQLSDEDIQRGLEGSTQFKDMLNRMTGNKALEFLRRVFELPFSQRADLRRNAEQLAVETLNVTPEEAATLGKAFEKTFDGMFDRAGVHALGVIEKMLSEAERRRLGVGKRYGAWIAITKAVRAGRFDAGWVMQRIAALNGYSIPGESELARVRELAERLEMLRTLPAELATPLGSDRDALRAALAKFRAGTGERQVAIQREIGTIWAKWTRPFTVRTQQGRANIVEGIYEFSAANILLKLGFITRQSIDVSNTAVLHIPFRSFANAMTQHGGIIRGATNVEFWQDANNLLRQSVTAQTGALRAALREFRAAIKGTAEIKNVDRLLSGIALFERVGMKADELAKKGDHVRAFIMRLFGAVRFSYRFASAWDNLQGVPQEWQEMHSVAYRAFRDNGMSPAEANQRVGRIMPDKKADYLRAVELAKRYYELAEPDREPTTSEIESGAWHILKGMFYQEMREAGMPADDFEAKIRLMRSTNAWNENMAGVASPGGVMATAIKKVGELGKNVPIPFGLMAAAFGRFGNAIGIGIDKALMATPLGMFPAVFGVPAKYIDPETGMASQGNPFMRSPEDRAQRKVESAVFSSLMALAALLVLGGYIVVRNRWPRDKDERELWDANGWRPGTAAIQLGDGKEIVLSMTVGPMAPLRPGLAAAGAVQDALDRHAKQQAKLNAEAARRGLPPGEVKPLNMADMMGVAAETMWASAMGGRTSGGLIGSLTDYGTFDATKSIAANVSPLLPGLPGLQEASRLAGVTLDNRLATVLDFMVPLPTSKAAKVNLLGDPAGNPNDVQRIVQILTGGSYPGITDAKAGKDRDGYAALFSTGYRPPSIDPNKGYGFADGYRPMSDGEVERYSRLRGQYFKAELAGLGSEPDAKAVRQAFTEANRRALGEIGVSDAARTSLRASSAAPAAFSGLPVASLSPRLPSIRRPSGRSLRPRLSRGRIGRRSLRLSRGPRLRPARALRLPSSRVGRRSALRRTAPL